MNWMETAKKRAAISAVTHVKSGQILGLGSGTTIAYALEEIGRKISERKFHVSGVPTSYQTLQLAVKHNIPLTTLEEHPQLDLVIDGADQVDRDLNMIKGMGGALTREKIIASASKIKIFVVDETKLTNKLGTDQPVPIEVLPFALTTIMEKLCKIGAQPVLREAAHKLGPVISDNGNFLIDAQFGSIDNPEKLNLILKTIPGIVETGLFLGFADVVYVGGKTAVRKLER